MSKYRFLLPQLRRPSGAGRGARCRGLVRSDDEGFSLIEVIVAIGIFAVIAAFMAQTLAAGFSGVLLGKRRELATQEANRIIEIARSLSYDAIGLVQSDSTINNDSAIQTQNSQKSYLSNATWEPLIWATNPTNHPFNPHIANLTRGSTDLTRYVYITGVDSDPGDGQNVIDLKRITVRVTWSTSGTPGPANEVRAQSLINESGLLPTGGSSGVTTPLKATTFATGGSLNVSSSLLGLTTPVDIALPTTTGSSEFRAVSETNCTTKSANVQALNLVDLPGYSVTVTADDDPRTATPAEPAQATSNGALAIPLGAVGNLLGPVVGSPVSCQATTSPLPSEQGSGSALSALNATGSAGLLGLLTLANAQTLPITQDITHQVVSGQREVAASASGGFGQIRLLQIPLIAQGLVQIDSISYGASVRAANGTPSVAPSVTAPLIALRVYDNASKISGCSSRSGGYCIINVDPSAVGFTGLSIDVSHNFTQLLGLNLVNLVYSAKVDILPTTKTPVAGELGPNGERTWSAEYHPISISASLDANLLGIPLIDADVALNIGGVKVQACAGATCP